eukprot:gene18889-19220_t
MRIYKLKYTSFIFALSHAIIVSALAADKNLAPEVAAHVNSSEPALAMRPDIVDRNNTILAHDQPIVSVYANLALFPDKNTAIRQIVSALPDLQADSLTKLFASKANLVWIKRNISVQQQSAVRQLNLAGLSFLSEFKRKYPFGRTGAHVLGFLDAAYNGKTGIEKYIDHQGLTGLSGKGAVATSDNLKPVRLSIDIKANEILTDELRKGLVQYQAKAAAGLILDVNSGEVLALASLPDFDPEADLSAYDAKQYNRLTGGVFEFGSAFKLLTLGMALDSKTVDLNSQVDARHPLQLGKFTIHDYHEQDRILSLPETFTFSSNIAHARISQQYGFEKHRAFLEKLGLFETLKTELSDQVKPIVPHGWTKLNSASVSFGHGFAVSPLEASMATAAMVNGGYIVWPTFLAKSEIDPKQSRQKIIQSETSAALRYLLRLNTENGSAKMANPPNIHVGGTTGTAEKVVDGHYSSSQLFTSFFAFAPIENPKYLFLTILDEPQASTESQGFATAGWNAAPITAHVMERVAPILGLEHQNIQPGPTLSERMKVELDR